MYRYLIINLKRHGDILSSARLINSILSNDNKSKVDLLIFQEFERSAKCLRQIDTLYSLDRKKILTLKKSMLFSDGFALDYFYKFLKGLKKSNYHQVVNLSNDHVSAYITSYLSCDKRNYHGVRFSKTNIPESSNQWAMVFNEILTQYQHTPINYVDCYHKIMGIPLRKKGDFLKINTEHDETAFKNFSIIRKNTSGPDLERKIIGVQLKSSMKEKDIPKDILISLLKNILESKEYFPVMLIAPIKSEREYVEEINSHFADSLVTVEADFLAVTSVIKNLDLLITPDTVIKHIADLCNIPILEISLGYAPFLKQGIYNIKSMVLTDTLKKRKFKVKEASSMKTNIVSQDIMKSVKYMFSIKKEKVELSPGVALYRSIHDSMGIRYDLVMGDHDPNLEITRLMARYYISKIMNVSEALPREILKFSTKNINRWVYDQKDYVNNATRNLLNTLRSLLSIKDNIYKIQKFVWDLDKLLEYSNASSIIAMPTLLFSAGIESISDKTQIKNIQIIENLLYKLKEHYQTAIVCIKHLEKNCFDNQIRLSREKLIESRKLEKRDGEIQA